MDSAGGEIERGYSLGCWAGSFGVRVQCVLAQYESWLRHPLISEEGGWAWMGGPTWSCEKTGGVLGLGAGEPAWTGRVTSTAASVTPLTPAELFKF